MLILQKLWNLFISAVTGAKVRVKDMKKPLVISRPVQKLFPIEVRNKDEQAESQSGEFGGPALVLIVCFQFVLSGLVRISSY